MRDTDPKPPQEGSEVLPGPNTAAGAMGPKQASTDQAHRSRRVVAASLVGALALGAFCVIHIVLDVASMATALGIASLMVAMSPFLLRRSGSIVAATNWGVGWAFASIAFIVWVGGGLLSPALQFVTVLVLAAVLLAGRWSGVVWASVSIAYVFLLYGYEAAGGTLPILVDTEHIKFMWLPTTTGILVVTLVMATLYAHYERTAVEALERTNQDLEKARDQAEAGLRSQTSFLANVSHEIRTPMNAVVGLTGLLLREETTSRQRDYLKTIRASGEHLLTLINDVLDFSKIEAGPIELETHPFDLHACIQECADLLALSAENKKLAVAVVYAADSQRYVIGDAGRVRQVVVNLLANAIKFTDEGEVIVEVRSRALSDDDIEIELAVIDTGIGISDEQAQGLFKPFAQADSSTTRRYGGTGLGLVISRRICEAMGGTLRLESKPGVGSTFTAVLKMKEAEAPSVEQPLSSSHETAFVPQSATSLRVLVVEDNRINQVVAVMMLEKLGCRADVACDGREALDALERQQYDVVFMDVHMPNMDGLTASRRIHEQWSGESRPRIIAMTANALAEDRVACMDAGMDDYLMKPVSFDALIEHLAECTPLRH